VETLLQFGSLALELILILLPSLHQASLQILGGIIAIIGGFILLIIGILIIVLIVGAAIFLLPAIIVGIIIWFFTGSLFYAGVAFLIIALISLVRRK
jgi:hypothetical protein